MSELTTGQAAKRATEFLRAFHDDVAAMIETLDGKFAERGWYPTERNRISQDLGNGLSSDNWVIRHIVRLYVRHLDAPASRAIAFGIHFASAAFDSSVCFIAVGRFPEGTSNSAIWDEWEDSSPLPVAIARLGGTGPVKLEGEARAGIFPAALDAEGFVVALDNLNNSDALDKLLVEPTLAALSRLG